MKHKTFFLLIFSSLLSLCSLNAGEEIPVSGTLYPTLTTKITTHVTGRVQEIFVGTGTRVEKGQILAKLDPTHFEIDVKKCQTSLELAKLSHEDAKAHFMRMKNLWDKEDKERAAIPKTQYDKAYFAWMQSKLMLEQAQLNLDQVELRLNETEIKAPYNGVITARFADPGASITAMANPLFEIMDISSLIFEFTLPQNMLGKVKVGQCVTSDCCLTGGTIVSILPQVDATNRLLKYRVVIPNADLYLKPGLFVTAKVLMEEDK